MKHELVLIPEYEGLSRCLECRGAEGSLTKTDCPGKKQTHWHDNAVFEIGLDFVNGCWVLHNFKYRNGKSSYYFIEEEIEKYRDECETHFKKRENATPQK